MKRLGSILEEAGVIDEIQLVRALSHHRKWNCRLGASLIELGFADEGTIAKAISKQLNIPFQDFDASKTPGELFDLIPRETAQEKGVFPVGYSPSTEGKTVLLAMSDPSDKKTLEDLERAAGVRIAPVVARDSAIEDAISKWDKYASSNPKSTPEDLLAAAHKDTQQGLGASEEEILEDLDVLDDESELAEMEEEFDRGVPPPEPSPPTGGPEAVSAEGSSATDLDDVSAVDDAEGILSAAGLPHIDEEDEWEDDHEQTAEEAKHDATEEAAHVEKIEEEIEEIEEIEEVKEMEEPEAAPSESTELAIPDSPENDSAGEAVEKLDTMQALFPESHEKSMSEIYEVAPPLDLSEKTAAPEDTGDSDAPEIIKSEPWEHIMPGVDAAKDVGREQETSPEEESDAPEIIKSEPWEHIMPGVDAAKDVGREQETSPEEESDAPEIIKSEPWEHIMPGVDAAKDVGQEQEASPEETFSMDKSPIQPVEIDAEPVTSEPPPPPARPAGRIEEQSEQPKAEEPATQPATIEELTTQIKDLKAETSMLREQMKGLKETIAKLKQGD